MIPDGELNNARYVILENYKMIVYVCVLWLYQHYSRNRKIILSI